MRKGYPGYVIATCRTLDESADPETTTVPIALDAPVESPPEASW